MADAKRQHYQVAQGIVVASREEMRHECAEQLFDYSLISMKKWLSNN